jgi:hypothetical protein
MARRRKISQPKCHKCSGRGRVDCPSCEGYGGEGSVECSECHASEDNGRYAEVPCPACNPDSPDYEETDVFSD